MTIPLEMFPTFSRRDALKFGACGFGYLAFAGIAAAEQAKSPLAPKEPHFKARAKHVIFLCMEGAPSHVDTFDHKPKLTADDGKSPPAGKGRTPLAGKLLGSPFKFAKQGKSGIWMSELFPELAGCADEMCMLNGMQTSVPAHPQAYLQLHTGTSQFVRPSLGAWTLYGLGTENRNLPGFVSINPPPNNGGAQNYGSSFLPAICQGTRLGNLGRPTSTVKIPDIGNPKLDRDTQRAQLDFIQTLNQERLRHDEVNPQVEGLIESYELAFRMQSDFPDVLDLSKEPKETRELYGIGNKTTDDFGRQCLLARRFIQAGVRFVELTSPGWDHHRDLKAQLTKHTASIDKPIAGLLTDLKRVGLLDDTLVIWTGEFGRTPYAQGPDGRDHNHKGFTAWMAGGGVKRGFTYGGTDDYGFEAVSGKIPTHDFHATILHLLGLDHEKLVFNHAGRDFRLTDIAGNVVKDIIA